MKYNQKLPEKVEKDLDAYIERIKNIKWFKPSSDITKEKVDTAVNVALDAFGVKASIEYRSLKTKEDYDAARDAAYDAAWGAADVLATHTDTYIKETPFLKLVDIWEMGMYPVGVVDGKFIVYTPVDFEEKIEEKTPDLPDTLTINGVTYKKV